MTLLVLYSALTWKFSLEQSEHITYMGGRRKGGELKVGRMRVVVCVASKRVVYEVREELCGCE
jgi:hypothetical protein